MFLAGLFLRRYNSGDMSIATLVLVSLFVFAYLFYTYKEAVSFKAFVRLPEVKAIYIGTFALFTAYTIINTFFFRENEIKEIVKVETQEKEKIDVLNYTDSIFYNPKLFIPYLYELKSQLDTLNKGEVKRYMIEEELNHVYNYWLGLCADRANMAGIEQDVNLGILYLGYFAFLNQENEKALDYLSKTDPKVPNRNFAIGLIYQSLNKNEKAEQAFLAEIKLLDSRQKIEAYSKLADVYLATSNDCAFMDIYSVLPQVQEKVDRSHFRTMNMKCEGPVQYYTMAWKAYYGNADFFMVFTSFLMSLLWLVYFYRLDVFKKERIGLLIGIFVFEMVMLLFVLIPWLDYQTVILGAKDYSSFWIDFVFMIGVPEESIKILPLILMMYFFKKEFEEPFDILLYAAFSAAGFAFMENIIYVQHYDHHVVVSRTILCSLGHITDTCIIAYGFVLAKFKPSRNQNLMLPVYFLLSCFLHGLYDYLIEINLFYACLIVYFFSLTFLAICINNCMNNSPHFTYKIWVRSLRLVDVMLVGFIFLFLYEYFVINFTLGTNAANASLVNSLLFRGLVLGFVATKLTNFDLVKGYWKEVYFTKMPNEFKVHATINPLAILTQYFVANSIYPQNFVGLKIRLHAHFQNKSLQQLFQTERNAVFVDRIIAEEYEKSSSGKYVSFITEKFFVVVMRNPIVYNQFSSPVLLLRFRSNTVSLGGINKQSVKLYFVEDLKKVKRKQVDLKDFPYLGMAVIHLNETIVS